MSDEQPAIEGGERPPELPPPEEEGERPWRWQFNHDPFNAFEAGVKIKSRPTHKAKIPIGFNYTPEEVNNYTLKNLVSSKMARDIVRSTKFMPGAFEIWNKNPKGGNNKYRGGAEDLDGDKISEFVVRRDGKIVAVNGYTTKNSDAVFKNLYYTGHDTKDKRKEQSFKDWIYNDYYGPVYNDDYSEVTRWAHHDPVIHKAWSKRMNIHAPSKSLSPYQAFARYIVAPACKQAFLELGGGTEEGAKFARKVAVEVSQSKAFEASLAAAMYAALVKDPCLSQMQDLKERQNEFVVLKQQYEPNYHIDFESDDVAETPEYKAFEKWLFAKPSVKQAVRTYMHDVLTTSKEEYINTIKGQIITYLNEHVKGYRQKYDEDFAAAKEAARRRYGFD